MSQALTQDLLIRIGATDGASGVFGGLRNNLTTGLNQVKVAAKETGAAIEGVSVAKVAKDTKTSFRRILEPGHPDADKEGYVLMPNVDLPIEMMHLVLASRSYQANAAVLKRYQESVDLVMELIR